MQAMRYELLEQIRKKLYVLFRTRPKLYFCLGQKGTKNVGHMRKYTFEGSN